MPEQIQEQTESTDLSRRYRIADTALNLMLASSIVLGANFYEGDDAAHSLPEITGPSTEQLTQTEKLLEQPDSTPIADTRTMDKHKSDDRLQTDLDQISAAKNRLHLPLAFNYIRELEEDARHDYKLPFSTYLEKSQSFFDQYNINVTTNNARELMNDPTAKSLDAKQFETKIAKQDMVDLVESFAVMPREYVALGGIKTVLLYRSANASAQYNKGTVAINLTDEHAGGNVNHEVFHGISEDLTLGEGYDISNAHDLKILEQNSTPYAGYENLNNKAPTAEGYREQVAKLTDMKQHDKPGQKEYAGRLKTYREQVSFTDSYGATNPAEDAAQIGRYFAAPWAADKILNPAMPRLREKAIVWLTRIRLEAPKVFSYINDVIPPIGQTKRERASSN
jgi:hypothetical protein